MLQHAPPLGVLLDARHPLAEPRLALLVDQQQELDAWRTHAACARERW